MIELILWAVGEIFYGIQKNYGIFWLSFEPVTYLMESNLFMFALFRFCFSCRSIVGAFFSWCDLSFGCYWFRWILWPSIFKCLICSEIFLACSSVYQILWRVQFLNFLICWKGILIWMHWRPLTKAMVHLIWLNFALSGIPIDHLTLSCIQIQGTGQDLQISLSICQQIFTQLVFVRYMYWHNILVFVAKGTSNKNRCFCFCVCSVTLFLIRYDKIW